MIFFADMVNLVSFANKQVLNEVIVDISFMYIKNKNGSRVESCETLQLVGFKFVFVLLNRVY